MSTGRFRTGRTAVPTAHLKGGRLEWSSRVLLKPCNPHNHRLETFLAALLPGPLLLPTTLSFRLPGHMGDLGVLWHLGHATFNVAQFKAHFWGIQQRNFLGLPFTANVPVEALPVALPNITSYQIKPSFGFLNPTLCSSVLLLDCLSLLLLIMCFLFMCELQ